MIDSYIYKQKHATGFIASLSNSPDIKTYMHILRYIYTYSYVCMCMYMYMCIYMYIYNDSLFSMKLLVNNVFRYMYLTKLNIRYSFWKQ